MRGWFECHGRDYPLYPLSRTEIEYHQGDKRQWVGIPVYYDTEGRFYTVWPFPCAGVTTHVTDDDGHELTYVKTLAECEGPW